MMAPTDVGGYFVSRPGGTSEGQFDLRGLELILGAHPAYDSLDKVLQRFGEGAGQETCLLAGLEQAVAIASHQAGGNPTDALARLWRCDVAPTFVFPV